MRGSSDSVAERIRRRIEGREWAEGDRLPTERELAQEFGVARNTVRRALGRLERAGLLRREVGRGTFLHSRPVGDLAAVIDRMQGTSPADMMEVRLLLEPEAAAFAATNAGDASLGAIREAHERTLTAAAMPEFEFWDTRFHHLILACTRNDLLREIYEILKVIRSQPRWNEIKARSFTEARRSHYCGEHAAILDALLARDPGGAAEAMSRHLLSVQENLLGARNSALRSGFATRP
jgi:DNA-binding FadR family transcriptional regulator